MTEQNSCQSLHERPLRLQADGKKLGSKKSKRKGKNQTQTPAPQPQTGPPDGMGKGKGAQPGKGLGKSPAPKSPTKEQRLPASETSP